ncbi:MAG: hypothetical protein DRJ52_07175 [Thermoprotei archaeon]|nr:MAG: hypothetical protein DRJ52_07175 [Thermoprotei archaeon]
MFYRKVWVICSSGFYFNGSALVPTGIYIIELKKYIDLSNSTRLYLIGVKINGKYYNTSKVTLNITENAIINTAMLGKIIFLLDHKP